MTQNLLHLCCHMLLERDPAKAEAMRQDMALALAASEGATAVLLADGTNLSDLPPEPASEALRRATEALAERKQEWVEHARLVTPTEPVKTVLTLEDVLEMQRADPHATIAILTNAVGILSRQLQESNQRIRALERLIGPPFAEVAAHVEGE